VVSKGLKLIVGRSGVYECNGYKGVPTNNARRIELLTITAELLLVMKD
jgi:hypothetical protein